MALSDPQGILASPLTIIHRQDETKDVERVEQELSSEEKDKILFTRELKRIESERAIYRNPLAMPPQ